MPLLGMHDALSSIPNATKNTIVDTCDLCTEAEIRGVEVQSQPQLHRMFEAS